MNEFKKALKERQKDDARLIQARISKPIYDKLRAKLKSDNVTIQDFIETAAILFLREK